MKKDETWKPKVVKYERGQYKVGEKIGDTVFTKKDEIVSFYEFQGGIIVGFEKRHYVYAGYGPFSGKECSCLCHSEKSGIEEPCEDCKDNDQGFIVEILVPMVPKQIHIDRLTKNKSLAEDSK